MCRGAKPPWFTIKAALRLTNRWLQHCKKQTQIQRRRTSRIEATLYSWVLLDTIRSHLDFWPRCRVSSWFSSKPQNASLPFRKHQWQRTRKKGEFMLPIFKRFEFKASIHAFVVAFITLVASILLLGAKTLFFSSYLSCLLFPNWE